MRSIAFLLFLAAARPSVGLVFDGATLARASLDGSIHGQTLAVAPDGRHLAVANGAGVNVCGRR